MYSIKTQTILVIALASLAACGGQQETGQQKPSRSIASASALRSGLAAPNTTEIFSQPFANYRITSSAEKVSIVSKLSPGNPMVLPINTILRFSDTSASFDADGFSGQAYRIYRAAFDRKPDLDGLGFWIGVMRDGSDLNAIAEAFISSAEFQVLYGANSTNVDVITAFYKNVLKRTPDTAGMTYWLNIANMNLATRSQILSSFTESTENKAATENEIAGGIFFREYGVDYASANPPLAKIAGLATGPIGKAISLDGQGSVANNGTALTYLWTLEGAPANSKASLTSTSAPTTSFTPDLPGDYVISLSVIEGRTASTAAKTVITAGDIASTIGQPYVARNGITVTIDKFDSVDLGNGYVDYRITYTQNNYTPLAIDEGTLKLYYMDNSSSPQYGFFNKIYPNTPLTRSYNFTELKTVQPNILQYDHDHFFAAAPINGAVQWKYGSLVARK